MTSLVQKQHHFMGGHTLIYILSKFEVNWTNSSCVIGIIVSSPCFADLTII